MKKPKMLVLKGRKQFFEDLGREVTIVKERDYYVEDTSKDFSTNYGTIKKSDLAKKGIVKSNSGKEFHCFDASFIDMYKRVKRAPQIIPLKDIGLIIARTGVGPESVVVEGGSGSGALGIMLARHVKKVYSFDVDKDNLDVAKSNAEDLGLKNMEFREGSLYEPIDVKDADLLCLDLPEPWKALDTARGCLRQGAFIVSYSPTIVQAADFVNAVLASADFIHLRTVEVIEREWEVDGRKVRPKSKSNIHSGFLSFGRFI